MTCFSRIFALVIIFLSTCVWCDDWNTPGGGILAEPGPQHDRFVRRNPAVFVRQDIYEPLRYEAEKSSKGTPFLEDRALDGPSLLASWLGARQLVCNNAGYFVCANDPSHCCPNGDGCCPSGSLSQCCPVGQDCCSDSIYCVEKDGVCCGTVGSCPSGWSCCEDEACYPAGAECCANGNYCNAGSVCVIFDGVQKCSITGGGVTQQTTKAAAPPSSTPAAPPPTTPAPTTTAAPVVYTYFYYTITWWYIEWYYTWTLIAEAAETAITSTTITEYTTISIYESNSVAASSSFHSLSATLSLPTPAARTNPVVSGTSPAVPSAVPSSVPSSTSKAQVGTTGLPAGVSPGSTDRKSVV